jgi:hypothetical protein
VIFDIGTGSSGESPAPNSWVAGNYGSVAGTVKLVRNALATLYISGVQLEQGTQATSFDFRDYGSELLRCQRYYQIGSSRMVQQNCDVLRNSQVPITLMTQMRTTPTLGNTNTDSQNVGGATVTAPYVNGLSLQWNCTSTIDFVNVFNWTASAEL